MVVSEAIFPRKTLSAADVFLFVVTIFWFLVNTAKFWRHPSSWEARNLPEEELPGLHGEPILQRDQHHRPGKETQTPDTQRGEFFLSCTQRTVASFSFI